MRRAKAIGARRSGFGRSAAAARRRASTRQSGSARLWQARQTHRTRQTRRALRPTGAGCSQSGGDCGRGRLLYERAAGCSMAGAIGCKTSSDTAGSDDAATGCISLSDCACAGRGAISAVLPAAIRMPWLPSGKSSREQPQVASMPGAAPNPCNRSSRIAPFASNRPASRAICRRCGSAGPKVFSASAAALGRAEQAGAGRIGPQDPRAVGRPQPGGQGARRIGRQSRIAERLQLKFRIIHRNHMTARQSGSAARMPTALRDR